MDFWILTHNLDSSPKPNSPDFNSGELIIEWLCTETTAVSSNCRTGDNN